MLFRDNALRTIILFINYVLETILLTIKMHLRCCLKVISTEKSTLILC